MPPLLLLRITAPSVAGVHNLPIRVLTVIAGKCCALSWLQAVGTGERRPNSVEKAKDSR